MNRMILGGRLATDLRIQTFEKEKEDGSIQTLHKASFLLAFSGNSHYISQFIWCQVWGQKRVEAIQKYLQNGDYITLEGEIRGLPNNQEETRERIEEKKYLCYVVVDTIYDYIRKKGGTPDIEIPEEPIEPGRKRYPWE